MQTRALKDTGNALDLINDSFAGVDGDDDDIDDIDIY